MKFPRHVALPLIALMAACSEAPRTAPPPAPAAPQGPVAGLAGPVGTVEVGQAQGCKAVLSISAGAGGYALKQAGAVHRWTADDIVEYEVELKVRGDGDVYDPIGGGVKVVVPAAGAHSGSKAVFTNLSQGRYYRAFVHAKGDVGGTAATTVLNGVPATADFDFTAAQDVAATLDREVRIVFDGVAFSGTGNVTFARPSDGTYVNPAAGPMGAVVTPTPVPTPTPTPMPTPLASPTILGHFAAGYNPMDVAVDIHGNVWVGQYSHNSIRVLNPDGSARATYPTGNGGGVAGVAADGLGNVWAGQVGTSGLLKYAQDGTVQSFPLEGGAYAVAVDGADNVWAYSGQGFVRKFANDGTTLFTKALNDWAGGEGIAIDAANHVWVTETNANRVTKLDAAGNILAQVAVGSPCQVALDAAGNAYVTNMHEPKWYRISAAGVLTDTFTNAGAVPRAIGVDEYDRVWIADSGAAPPHQGTLYAFSTAGVLLKQVWQGPDNNYSQGFIAFDRTRRRLWKSNYQSNNVTALDY